MSSNNAFGARSTFDTGDGEAVLYRIDRIERDGIGDVERLPYSIRVLLESVLRQHDGFQVEDQHVVGLATWKAREEERTEHDAAAATPALPRRNSRAPARDGSGRDGRWHGSGERRRRQRQGRRRGLDDGRRRLDGRGSG